MGGEGRKARGGGAAAAGGWGLGGPAPPEDEAQGRHVLGRQKRPGQPGPGEGGGPVQQGHGQHVPLLAGLGQEGKGLRDGCKMLLQRCPTLL